MLVQAPLMKRFGFFTVNEKYLGSLIGFWWSADLPKCHLQQTSIHITWYLLRFFRSFPTASGLCARECVCVCTFSIVLSMVTSFLIELKIYSISKAETCEYLQTLASCMRLGFLKHFHVSSQSQFLYSFWPHFCFLTVLVPLFDIHKLHYRGVQRSLSPGEATLAGFSREKRE